MTAPDLSDYRIIHDALRTAPHRLDRALSTFRGSRDQARALDRYWRGYAGEVLAHHTGRTVEEIHVDTERDRFMSAEEARDYGLVDGVVEVRELVAARRVGLSA